MAGTISYPEPHNLVCQGTNRFLSLVFSALPDFNTQLGQWLANGIIIPRIWMHWLRKGCCFQFLAEVFIRVGLL